MELKDRLKELRREKGVSAGELASLTNKAESTVRTWETGKSFPDADTLSKLADHFDVSVDWLLGRSTYSSPEQTADYEWKFINLKYRRQIEQLKKRLIDLCDNHRADMSKSPLFMGWLMDTFNECVELFDKLLDEVEHGNNSGSVSAAYLRISDAINKLGFEIACAYLENRINDDVFTAVKQKKVDDNGDENK